MKKSILLISSLLLVFFAYTQQQKYLRYKNFDVVYSVEYGPVWVFYKLDATILSCATPLKHADFTFAADPRVPGTSLAGAYSRSGYDRGHMMPAAHNVCDKKAMKECFYYTNISPQTPQLNRGHWKAVETMERKLAREGKHLTVMCGNEGKQRSLGTGTKVAVPDYCWKIIIAADLVRGVADTLSYLFPDEKTLNPELKTYQVNYQELEQKLGYTIADMVKLNELTDPAQQATYIKERISNQFDEVRKMTTEDVVKQFEARYATVEELKLDFPEAATQMPENFTVRNFAEKQVLESRNKLDQLVSNALTNIQANNTDELLGKFINKNTVRSVVKAGLCGCCGLPLAFPFCACRPFRR